ncbi:MAG: rubredoxin [Methanobrevibacter sp.]|nr:rubredoxin [Methanobrevibacter sp.]
MSENGAKYTCEMCGYVYDPEEGDLDNGIDAGTSFEDLPDDWSCPMCGVGKEEFAKE